MVRLMEKNKMYRVRSPYDTLWGIARDQLGDPMKYRDIAKWNGIKNLVVHPGQILVLYDPKENNSKGVKK